MYDIGMLWNFVLGSFLVVIGLLLVFVIGAIMTGVIATIIQSFIGRDE